MRSSAPESAAAAGPAAAQKTRSVCTRVRRIMGCFSEREEPPVYARNGEASRPKSGDSGHPRFRTKSVESSRTPRRHSGGKVDVGETSVLTHSEAIRGRVSHGRKKPFRIHARLVTHGSLRVFRPHAQARHHFEFVHDASQRPESPSRRAGRSLLLGARAARPIRAERVLRFLAVWAR